MQVYLYVHDWLERGQQMGKGLQGIDAGCSFLTSQGILCIPSRSN